MRNSGCNERKLRVRARPRNGAISLFQRFLKMGASIADCIWQIAESIPELPNHELNIQLARSGRKAGPSLNPRHKLWVSRRTFLLVAQAFWLTQCSAVPQPSPTQMAELRVRSTSDMRVSPYLCGEGLLAGNNACDSRRRRHGFQVLSCARQFDSED